MTPDSRVSGLLMAAFSIGVVAMSVYFCFVTIQGEYGIFRRVQLEAQEEFLRREHATLVAEREEITNKTRRLSTEFLDLDLLDEQARRILGMARGDELVLK
ncbi:MAG: septum formation initiator family protein [Pseudomonadota bacterium]